MRFGRVLLGLAVGVVVLGGCSAPSSQSSSVIPGLRQVSESSGVESSLPVGEEAKVVRDQARWILPLDSYWAPRTSNLASQASSILLAECMSEAGFPQYQQFWDMNAPAPENKAGNGISIFFNEDLAAKYGYHQAPDYRYIVTGEPETHGGSVYDNEPTAFWDQLGRCETAMNEQLGMNHVSAGSPDQENPIAGIKSQMNQLSWDSMPERMVEAAGKWRECMAPLGIADLPDFPWGAGNRGLPESLESKWAWQPIADPSKEEIEFAVADAKCRRSSGWFDADYDSTWELEEAFIAEHKNELAPLLEKNNEDAKLYEEIVSNHSGN